MSIRTATISTQPMQASKWLDLQALLDVEEMSLLINSLGSPYFFLTGCVCKQGDESLSASQFITAYTRYIDALKAATLPDEQEFRPVFSAVMTVTPEVLYAIPVEGNRNILRLSQPAVQMQFHKLGYSKIDNTFRPMAFGQEGILWGIQYSYPQLFQDLKTHEVFTVNESPKFPNTALFRSIQRWMRQHTVPTPFLADGTRVNVPMRLGKQCFQWINRHPQLQALNLSVAI